MSVARDHVCHNATEVAVIEGEVLGYPLATVFFYEILNGEMQLVRAVPK